jgi:peptidylprolyl isomerase
MLKLSTIISPWNLKIKKLAIEEQSKKKYDEKYKDVRQDKMKYFNALQGRQHLPDLNTLSLKKRMAKPAKGAALFIHYAGFLEDGHLLIQV